MTASSTSRTNANIEGGSKQYPYPSHVNPASFVSVKLLGRFNYLLWQEQMIRLLESCDMRGFIEGTEKNSNLQEWKRSDTLVKEWIFGSLTETALRTVAGSKTAREVWNKLKKAYTTRRVSRPTTNTGDIIDEEKYVALYRAIQTGDWVETEIFLDNNPDALTCKLNNFEETTLHVAVGNPDNIYILNKLLERIHDPELLLTMVDGEQQNALHCAARVGNTKAARILVEKNQHLLFIPDKDNRLPIEKAIINYQINTFRYLFDVCKQHIQLTKENVRLRNPFEGKHGVMLLDETIYSGIFDVAYELLKEYPDLASTKYDDLNAPLYCIAKKWDAYPSSKRYNFYQRFVYSRVPVGNYNLHNNRNEPDIENQETCTSVNLINHKHIKDLHDDKVKHEKASKILELICEKVGELPSDHEIHYEDAIIMAVENDTPEVLRTITRHFPLSIWTSNKKEYSLFQLSIINRCVNVYKFFVHEVTQEKYLHFIRTDENNNNVFHLAGLLAPAHKLNLVTGAALQMQRELQWFKEVEKIMGSHECEQKNDEQETPIIVFRKAHEDLRQKGEDWMKKTAESYTITAALITTIVFAAAITVPGGNKEDTGKPNFETIWSFIIFAVADAISLFTSTISLLLFLSILTARYAEDDFLYKLPKRLILGLLMLIISVTAMMIAFGATLHVMFGQDKWWILIPVVVLTFLTIASFVILQYPLLRDLVYSTCGRGIFYTGNKSASTL